jgi:hypothetical protein
MLIALVNDFRQCTDPENGGAPFGQVRCKLYGLVSILCSTLGPNSGVEFVAANLVPFVVAYFLPPKSGVKLAASSKSGKQQKDSKGGKAELLHQKSPNLSSPELATASLTCLADVFKACGVFLRKSLHKNVQEWILRFSVSALISFSDSH